MSGVKFRRTNLRLAESEGVSYRDRFFPITAGRRGFRKLHPVPGDNVAMDAGEQLGTDIIDAIKSDRDVWVFDQILQGPDRLEHARKILLERRDACSEPDEVAFLTSIIGKLEKGAP